MYLPDNRRLNMGEGMAFHNVGLSEAGKIKLVFIRGVKKPDRWISCIHIAISLSSAVYLLVFISSWNLFP